MPKRRQGALPAAIFLFGLVGSVAAAILFARVEADRRSARFQVIANGAVAAVESRMLAQLTLLRGTAGFFHASRDITPDEFGAYVRRLRLERYYPGVLGIGYAAFARDAGEIGQLVDRARSSGSLPDFETWPAGRRESYSAILYLEPLNRLNRAALGFDMLSEQTRRAAMLAAAGDGNGRLSGKVRLVQEIEPVKQPGFLVYLPVYRGGAPGGISPGPANLMGWVYSPLRAYDLFQAVFARQDMSGMVVEIFDERAEEANLLYRSAAPNPRPGQTFAREADIAGHKWLIRVTSTPAFDSDGSPLLPYAIAIGGSLIALLLAALMSQQMRAAARIERQVEARTAQLSQANLQLRSEAKAREQAEAQLRQMQKMEAIGQLSGGIAHDFNNMLAIVIGNIDMALRRLDQPDRLSKSLSAALDGARRAAELTQRLLAFARRQALKPQAVDVNRLVDGMTELLRRSLGEAITLEVETTSSLPPVHADPAQLESAILNLAINGRDAMPEGGRLAIRTGLTESEEPGSGPRRYVRIAVSDTGMGMSEEVSAKAAEPFFTTKDVGKGTGLGLSQVYGFVSQSGGRMTIESQIGQGTTVSLQLPAAPTGLPTETVDRGEAGSSPSPQGQDELILLAEDEAQVRAMTSEALRELGYRVVEAENGKEALDLLERHGDVRLLFTDIVMPGMDGRRLAALARQLRPGLAILYTTGFAPDALETDDGDSTPLQKPFTASQLAVRVRAALDSEAV